MIVVAPFSGETIENVATIEQTQWASFRTPALDDLIRRATSAEGWTK